MSLFASVPQARDDVEPSSSRGDTGLVTHGPFARAWVTALQRVLCATRRRHWAHASEYLDRAALLCWLRRTKRYCSRKVPIAEAVGSPPGLRYNIF